MFLTRQAVNLIIKLYVMADYPHRFLSNPKSTVIHFDGSRGFGNDDEDDDDPEEVEKNYEYQKAQLRIALQNFNTSQIIKRERRTLDTLYTIDYIRIDFFVTFANSIEYNTRDIFQKNFGIHAIQYYDFNKSVLFEVNNKVKFHNLLKLIGSFIESNERIDPKDTDYNIVTLIHGFTLLTRDLLLKQFPDEWEQLASVALQLTHQAESSLEQQKNRLREELFNYLEQNTTVELPLNYKLDGDFLMVNHVNQETLNEIADNFDVIASVQAIRVPRAFYSKSGQFFAFDFTISPAHEKLPAVVVIDNGVNPIPPFGQLVSGGYTFDPMYPPLRPIGWHGTAVSVIATTGESFYSSTNRQLQGHCRIISYRVFENEGGTINLIDFENNIRDAAAKGICLFNLSLNIQFKNYNADYSFFSYLLDKLSYELNILFFISAGNLDSNDLNAIYNSLNVPGYHPLLKYPRHFFSPEEVCNEHSCDGTNLKVPAESLNNITVGAIAENLNPGTDSDMTLDKILPAYYTSKYHVSPYHKINGSRLKVRHINYRLYKPDIVYPGGDYGVDSANIQVTGSGNAADFYRYTCGTSFATPFATNLAAKIVQKYPTLSPQSVKALMINSASPTSPSSFLSDHLNLLKEKFSQSEFGKNVTALNLSEKRKINKWFHEEDLFARLTGHGQPDPVKALSSDNKTITVILEDTIKVGSHKAIPIRLPTYLNGFAKRGKAIVTLDATLCFKFRPNFKEQTGYNPLHISFNFIKTFDDADQTVRVAAYRNDAEGMQFYKDIYRGIIEQTERTKKRNKTLGIKSTIEPWSDDFYPNSRQFSNCQKMHLNINIKDLNKVNNSIALVVRCTGKNDADYDTQNYLNEEHPFSIVLTFSEHGGNQFRFTDFFREFTSLNQTLDIINTLTADAEGLDAEI